MSKISVVQMNSGLACSSLLIGYTWTPLDFSKKSLGEFSKELSGVLKAFVESSDVSWTKMSFVVASTADSLGNYEPYGPPCPVYVGLSLNGVKKEDFYKRLKESKEHYEYCLSELGFTPTQGVCNDKNGTTVKLWTVPVPILKEWLEYYG